MSIAFNQIHNIVRTYQRMLHLPKADATKPTERADREDRVSISAEAREQEEINKVAPAHEEPLRRNFEKKDQTL